MTITCVFFDCVGPLLVKNPAVKLDPKILQIDQMCGSATNDEQFWGQIKSQFSLSSEDVEKAVDEIAASYMKNESMWVFQENIRNKYKTAIINNGTFTVFEKWIRKYDMSSHFDNLFNSAKLGVRKPDKKIFEICAREMCVSMDQAVLIDDSQYNVDGAVTAGMSGLYYNPADHQTFVTSFNDLTR